MIERVKVPGSVFADVQEATAKILVVGAPPVTLVATEPLRRELDVNCYQQICNIAKAPGIEKVVVSPDFHIGYGCVVGSTFSSRTHLYPCAVGPDISCSMALMTMEVPADDFAQPTWRRVLIDAISQRVPSGVGAGPAIRGRQFDYSLLREAVVHGAADHILSAMGIDPEWGARLEDRSRGNPERLSRRLEEVSQYTKSKLPQIGSLGAGNHFLEVDKVAVNPAMAAVAERFGLRDNTLGVMTHCGSRGFGYNLTEARKGKKNGHFSGQFEKLRNFFEAWHIPFPGGDRHLVYAPVDSPEGQTYLDDMALGANFAIVNHLLLMSLVQEAFGSVFGKTVQAHFVYHIAHNIIREEFDPATNRPVYVHRKGATRAFPGSHHALRGTQYENLGHPILLPGSCEAGSAIMVACEGAKQSLYSVNHGAGRRWGRQEAKGKQTQSAVNKRMENLNILTNCRNYPLDESGAAYKDFDEVLRSVEQAGLAKPVARLSPNGGIVFKDSDQDPEGKG